MPSEVASAMVRIGADDSGLRSALSKIPSMLTSAIGGAVGGLKGGALGGALGGVIGGMVSPIQAAMGGGIGGLSEWIGKSAEAEANMVRFNAVLQASGGAAGYSGAQLKQMAQDLSETTTFTKGQILAGEKMLMQFNQIQGVQFADTMKAATDLATVFGTDVSSAAHALGRAMQDPITGMRGLREVGIQLTHTQRQVIEQLAQSGQIDQARAKILELAQGYSGAAAEMNNTVSGKLKQLGKKWEEFGKGIGDALLPIVTSVTETMSSVMDVIMGAVQGDTDKMTQAWQNLFGETTGIWNDIRDYVFGVLKGIVLMFQHPKLAAELAWDLIKLGAIQAADYITDRWREAMATFRATFAGMEAVAVEWWENLKAGFKILGNMVSGVFEAIGAGFKALASGENPFDAFKNKIQDAFKESFNVSSAAKGGYGKVFAEAYVKEFSDYLQGKNLGESAAAKQVKDDIARIRAEFAKFQAEKAKADKIDMTPGKGAGPEQTIKYQFSGIEDLYKKITEQVGGGTMVELQKQVVGNTARIVEVGQETREAVKALKPAAGTAGYQEPKG